MIDIKASTRRYETWLGAQLKDELVEADLDRKHDKMRDGPFSFLRATYWRWAETFGSFCVDMLSTPSILAIGDTHLENFGTWRDVDGRLVWGANDFDDAAVMPYPVDLVRLAASAMLAREHGSLATVCKSIWLGYIEGLGSPTPTILERDHRWLREAILLPEKARAKWWAKFDRGDDAIPASYRKALAAALPEPGVPFKAFARSAGTGSLGRPRFVGVVDWLGGPVVRECKAILPSAWVVFGSGEDASIVAGAIAGGTQRAVDPHYRVTDTTVVRRLSPNSRKVEVKDAGHLLFSPDMLKLMGHEIACCQAGDTMRLGAVRAHAAIQEAEWLHEPVRAAVAAVRRDFDAFQ